MFSSVCLEDLRGVVCQETDGLHSWQGDFAALLMFLTSL